MSSLGHLFARVALLGVVILFSLQVRAQAGGTVTVEEILVQPVTSASRPSPAVTVIDGAQIQERGQHTVAEVLRAVPGVTVADSGGSGQASAVFIRGAKSEHTLVLIDGIEVNDPTTTTRYFDFGNLTTDAIERIEVFRGPQATRFGPDAMGGVINIVTKAGSGPARLGYTLEGGSLASGFVATKFSQGTEKFNASVVGSSFATQSFSAARAGDNAEKDALKRHALSARLGWGFYGGSTNVLTYRLANAVTDLDYSGGPAGDDPNYEAQATQNMLGNTYAKKFFAGRLASTFGVYLTAMNREYDNAPDAARSDSYHEDFKSTTVKLETRQRLEFNSHASLELALQYRTEEASSDQVSNGTPSRLDPHRHSDLGEGLIYRHELGEWSIDTGLRQDYVEPVERSVWSTSAEVTYSPDAKRTLWRASYGTGFKSPSLFQLYSNFGSRDLRTEEVKSSELSLERKLSRDTFVSLAYFENRYDEMIDFNMTTSKYANIASAKSQGVELQGLAVVAESLTLKVIGNWLDTENGTNGKPLVRRPAEAYALEGDWRAGAWLASLRYRWVGRRDDIDPVSFDDTKLGEYDVVGANVNYDWSRDLRVYARVENIFNETYEDVAGYATPKLAGYAGLAGGF